MNSKVETAGSLMDTIKLMVAVLIAGAAIAAFYVYADQPLLYRVLGLVAAAIISILIALKTDKGRSIWGFFQDAQIEVKKVVWPTRQETLQTTMLVIAVVLIIAIILWLLDMFLGYSIGTLMGTRG